MNNLILKSTLSFALFTSLAACGGGDGTSNNGISNSTSTTWQFAQGKITVTDNPLDLAIRGAGLFQLDNGKTPPMYTRRGEFMIDAEGYILDYKSRMRLLMRQVSVSGLIQPGPAVPLQVRSGEIGPAPTTMIGLGLNLDASRAVTFPANGPAINFADAATYNNGTSLSVFDAKGQSVALTVYFQKSATDVWNVYATANGVSLGGDNTAPTAITTLTFPESGVGPTDPPGPISIDIPSTTNAAGAITLAVPGVMLDLTKATEFGTAFGVSMIKQNGYAIGFLDRVYFESNGMLMALYSNGRATPVGQVELATFSNMLCLQSGDDRLWFASQDCGQPMTGTPGSGFFNFIEIGALEGV
jgi:flagellar hook protein FlgE